MAEPLPASWLRGVGRSGRAGAVVKWAIEIVLNGRLKALIKRLINSLNRSIKKLIRQG